MKKYLANLNEREQWMVIAAAICVLIYIYYFLCYSPLSHRVNERKSQLVEKAQTLEWMQGVRGESHRPQSKQVVDNNQLLTLISDKLKESELIKFPYKLQQTNSGEIQLSFDQVPFTAFINWLIKIHEGYSISVKQLDVDQMPAAGITKLIVILSA